jgi:hypothetical protein
MSFSSYEEYEVHYVKVHVNRCSECGKNFPTERFLSLHIEENHDPLIEAKKERGEKTVASSHSGSPTIPWIAWLLYADCEASTAASLKAVSGNARLRRNADSIL